MPGYYERVYPVERVPGGKATAALSSNLGLLPPHVATNRWAYTVPSGTAAAIESLSLTLLRDAAPAPVGQAWISILDGLGTRVTILYELTAVVGAAVHQLVGECGYLRAGESWTAQSFDGSVGGSHTFNIRMQYREFPV